MSNYLRLQISMLMGKFVELMLSTKTTLPTIFSTLGAPTWILSLLVPIRESGSLLPQVFISRAIHDQANRLRVWLWANLCLTLCLLAMLLSYIYLSASLSIYALFFALCAYSLCKAVSSLSSKDIQSLTADKGRRGRLIGVASLVSGLLTGSFAALMMYSSVQLADIFIILLVASIAALVLSGLVMLGHSNGQLSDISVQNTANIRLWWRRLPQLDSKVKHFIVARSLLINSALVSPYVVLLLSDSWLSALPLLLIAHASAAVSSGYLWGWLADYSAKSCMILGAAVCVVALLPLIYSSLVSTINDIVILMCFWFIQLGHEGVRNGRKTYAIDIQEGQHRTDFIAMSNSVIGIVLLASGIVYAIVASLASKVILPLILLNLLVAIWKVGTLDAEK